MTHVRITIDGDTVMDTDISQWNTEPPAITDLKLQAAADQPWAIPTIQALTAAAIRQHDTDIDVTTGDTEFTLHVRIRR